MTGPGAPSLQQPPSTSDTYPPPPGGWWSSCYGTRWWTKRGAPYGWCCGWRHPPDHLKPEQVRWEPAVRRHASGRACGSRWTENTRELAVPALRAARIPPQ